MLDQSGSEFEIKPLGASQQPWQPVMTVNTASAHYWLNWRVLLCALWVFSSVVVGAILIWRYEGPADGSARAQEEGRAEDGRQKSVGTLYDDESWRPCLKDIHPAWLLAFRMTSFFVMLTLLIANLIVDGGSIFYYYTQWTFALVTIYFGLGSLLSIYGCHQYLNNKVDIVRPDIEQGTYEAPRSSEENANPHAVKESTSHEGHFARQTAGFWGYVFQIIYQTNAGAVMLTDCVFWFIIFPFLAIKDYDLNFLLIGMHSVNAVFLLGDTALNSLRFPWFRIGYFLLWTATYVIFQWIIHAIIPLWWPYPFLDLSSSRAPAWKQILNDDVPFASVLL
uniref:Uncharacterized protein n=1 Tax=Ananas comosus var. bracteatus TaxID=296719 RepID=A0A6V7Q583_ANACO|nr:unnamed protein product [Ananas comosus var. bracteatus]